MPSTSAFKTALLAILLSLVLKSTRSQPSSADASAVESPVECRIRLIGQPGSNGASPFIVVVSIICTGPETPITITTNQALLSAVGRGSVRGADLIDGGPDAPFLAFRFQNGITIRDSEIDELVGGGDAPIVFDGSTVRVVDSEFDRNTMGEAAVMRASRSILTLQNCSFRSNTGVRFGALAADDGTRLTIRDSTFMGNRGGVSSDNALASGAVMASRTTSLLVEGSTFRGNFAFGEGASAFLALRTSGANFTNNDFFMNTAENGGVLLVEGGEETRIAGCAFRDNNGGTGGGAVNLDNASGTFIQGSEFFDNTGGRAALSCFRSGVDVSASVFRFNTARGFGGAVATFGKPIEGGTHSFARCIFQDNGAIVGGAIAQEMASETRMEGCVFLQNNATAVGGVLYQWNCDTTIIEDSEFLDNTARLAGGALSQATCARWSPFSQDEALVEDCEAEEEASCGEVTLTRSIFFRNFANLKGGNIFQRGCADLNLTSNRFQYTPFFAVDGRVLYQQRCESVTMDDNEFEAVDIESRDQLSGRVITRKECPL